MAADVNAGSPTGVSMIENMIKYMGPVLLKDLYLNWRKGDHVKK